MVGKPKDITYIVIVHHKGKPAKTFRGFKTKAKNKRDAELKAKNHVKKYGLVFDLLYKSYSSKAKYLYPEAK